MAVTDELAAALRVGVGGEVELGDEARTVVGQVENPPTSVTSALLTSHPDRSANSHRAT